MIDVHCHLNCRNFDDKRDELIENTQKRFKYVIDSGASYKSNPKSKYPCRYFDL